MYCLTKNGFLGLIEEELKNGTYILHKVNKKGDTLFSINNSTVLRIKEDEIYCTDSNIEILNNKTEEYLDFSKFIGITFDISEIFYSVLSIGYFCKYEDKILDFLDKKDLKLIHLYNLDQYVIVDKKSIGKSITIKATIGAKSHLIGRHGNNIDRIKQINNFKNISVSDIENEEYFLLKKELAKKLEFLINQKG